MIEPEKRSAIFLLHREGMSTRVIAERLGVSRTTVRLIIRQQGAMPTTVRKDKIHVAPELLQELYTQCAGNAQRVYEKLVEERGVRLSYATLTRLLRGLGISSVRRERCDRVPDQPGAEMQHDTSRYRLLIDKQWTWVVGSLLYLRYSKRRYLQFYRSFNRFRMKCFLHEALMSWGFAAAVTIIDNTNLARLRGSGKNALIVPEMEAFAKQYGTRFVCHAIGHSDRKAGNERSFRTVETNFIPGRCFTSMEDLNAQALEWSTQRMYHRPVGKARLIPAKAFEHEKAYLAKLPGHLPAPYLMHERIIDQYGYIAFSGNFYWVPGTGRGQATVLQYSDRIKIYNGRELLSEYRLPPDGVRNQLVSPSGMPPPRYLPLNRPRRSEQEEKRLRAISASVGAYLDFALKPKGIERHGFVRKLLALSRKMTPGLFVRSIERALKYGVTSIEAIERIAALYMNQGEEKLPEVQIDEGFREREAYVEGSLTDQPDLSAFDQLLGEDDG